MITHYLLMMTGGIALAQTASDPQQVTLRWLRLGGIISVSLLAVAASLTAYTPAEAHLPWLGLSAVALCCVVQLLATQIDRRRLQRLAAAGAYLAVCALGAWAVIDTVTTHAADPALTNPYWQATLPAWSLAYPGAVSGLIGGFLMTMLLGHAYLSSGDRMTQAPFRRLVLLLAALLAARALLGIALGLWPYLTQISDTANPHQLWNTVMITARFAVGLAAPAVFIWMTHDCVKRRANQSATGILYVATVLVMLGEGLAFALMAATGLAF